MVTYAEYKGCSAFEAGSPRASHYQRQIARQAARSLVQPRPIGSLGHAGRPVRALVSTWVMNVEPHAVHFLLCARGRVQGVGQTGLLIEVGRVRAWRRTQQNIECDSGRPAMQRALVEPHAVAVDRICPQDLKANVVLARFKPRAIGVGGPRSLRVAVHDEFLLSGGFAAQGFKLI